MARLGEGLPCRRIRGFARACSPLRSGCGSSPACSAVSIGAVRGRRFVPAALPALRTHKPDWVVEEIVRLKALMPDAGCRRIADTFNRLHAAPCGDREQDVGGLHRPQEAPGDRGASAYGKPRAVRTDNERCSRVDSSGGRSPSSVFATSASSRTALGRTDAWSASSAL